MELEVDEIGASLQYATVKVNKAERSGASEQTPREPTAVSVPDDDQPPF
jgi:hypothetical protein